MKKTTSKSKKPTSSRPLPKKASEVLVTQAMLYGARNELIGKIDTRFHETKKEIHGVKSEIHGLKSEIHELKSEIHGVKSDISTLHSKVDRTLILMEEQNTRNKVVMDALLGLGERQEKLENDQAELRNILIKPTRNI